MASLQAPAEWEEWSEWLAAGLHGRSRWRLAAIVGGAVFASGRRVVAAWLRAAGIGDDYRQHYVFLQSVGRRWQEMGRRVLLLVLKVALAGQDRVLLVLDDSPSKRYGPHVEGAGVHHDPTPGPTGSAFCWGHVWVALAVAVRHPLWGTIGLPIWSWLYVREKDVAKLSRHGWTFRTKLELGADLVRQAVETLGSTGKRLWAVVDGAYAMRPFVRPVTALGVTLVGRLRRDAALRDVPRVPRKRGVGRPRKYGANRISLAKRAAHPQGWQDVTCTVYGREELKKIKTFRATHRTFGGAIRVVIVQERTGPQFFYCTDTAASPREIVETFADRAAIEQVFHDVKEVWGSGQQQVRNLWANIAAWNINLWLHTLVELWAWNRAAADLVHRSDSPWDDPDRRPSHADRRKSLQAACLEREFSQGAGHAPLPPEIRDLLQRLLRIAV